MMLSYFGAHLGKSLLWYASEAFIAFLLTEVIRLPASSVGWTLGLGFAVSAALDVAIGARFQKRLSSPVYAGRLQTIGSMASGSALVVLFAMPLLRLSNSLTLVVVTVVVFRVAYAFVDIPQNAILSTSTADDAARARFASARLAASGIAALTVSAMVSTIIYHATADRPALIVEAALTIWAISTGSSLVLEQALKRLPATERAISTNEAHRPWRFTNGIKQLLAAMFLTSFAAPVFAKLLPYYAAYRLNGPIMGGATIAAVSLGMVLGQPLLLFFLRNVAALDRIRIMASATAASALLFAGAGAGIGGWWIWGIPMAALLFGGCSAGLGATLWAAFADVVARRMKGQEGLAFGLFTASAKVSLAASGVGIGWLLSDASFRDGRSGILIYGMAAPAIVACLAIVALLAAPTQPTSPAQSIEL